jgi:branched-chain amino acid transport system substrate-binding protein
MPSKFSRRVPRPAAAMISGALLVSILAACGNSSLAEGNAAPESEGAAESAGPVKIGLSVPLSGVYAPLGEDMQQGFELYLDEHDGKLGGHEVDLVSADEGEGPQAGVPATQKLLTQDQVSAVVGIVNSATAAGLHDAFVQA